MAFIKKFFITFVIFIFYTFFSPTFAHAGSHFAHFSIIPNTYQSTKIAPGQSVYLLIYAGIKVFGQHPMAAGRLDISYPDQNFSFENAFSGSFFEPRATEIKKIQKNISTGHTYVTFISNPLFLDGGKTKVAMIIELKAKAESTAPVVITLGSGTQLYRAYNTTTDIGTLRTDPWDVIQPAQLLVSSSATSTAPPVPTAIPNCNGCPYPTKVPYTFDTGTSTTPPPASSPTPTVTPTPTLPAVEATYHVTVATKTSAHPQFGVGSTMGFVIDGVQGKSLQFSPGKTYAFDLSQVDLNTHPFYLSTSAVGQNAGVITEGITPTNANFIMYFTPTTQTPSTIYYQCANHPNMGWQMTTTSTATTPTPAYLRSDFGGLGGAKDNKVDIQDFNILAGEFYLTGTTLKSNIINTELSTDKVDIQDYNAFVGDYQAYLAR